MNAKILIVDDESSIRLALEFLMQDQGYTVATAANGQEGLAKVAEFGPQLIILDVMMPIMDGLEMAKEMRAQGLSPDTVILFLTAKGQEQDRLAGYAHGGDAYLAKPFDNQELVELIAEMLED
ncbi:response regulator transcription factor [Saprospira grandis]|uniref:Two-component system response regulator n=1 Tax=Saprospira grandis (strain Lewin) TaxID=984262 RepID=H6L1U4_SAPGL|nr:response regulator [Saprospira grandis]AFC26172.1 two-component system response regulator [Saprospira grandis str. Lewin]